MSYYPPQTYPPQYTTESNQSYYPSQYGQNTVYPLPAQASVNFGPTSPLEPHVAPELPAVTADLASHSLQRLLSIELRNAGFDSAEPAALNRLELEVVAFVEQIWERAHEYANLANRAGPIAKDLLLASEESGFKAKELRHVASRSKGKQQDSTPLTLLPPPSRSPSPEMLPSDDEEAVPVVPATLRTLPWADRYLPALPPKHTYLRTPVSPPKKAALPSLEKKLKNASLVQDSLKNLLLATEDSAGQEDGELLGAIVNWEATTHPRKRWRVSG